MVRYEVTVEGGADVRTIQVEAVTDGDALREVQRLMGAGHVVVAINRVDEY